MNRAKLGFNLQIIDTPGFGDTRGLKRDQELKEKIKSFFENKGGKGITHLNAVCFVVSASNCRLTTAQKYTFDSILSIFGKDIANKIYVLATFADAQTPPIIKALEEDRVPFKTVLAFNNSALFANNKKDVAPFSPLFWEMGMENFKNFFDQLAVEDAVSLQMSVEVLRKQKGIEIAIQSLIEQIQHKADDLAELEKHMNILQQKNMEPDAMVTVSTTHYFLEDVEKGRATNCTNCEMTCHDECFNMFDMTVYLCEVFSWEGKCIVCPGKCSSRVHVSSRKKHVRKTVKESITRRELFQKYKDDVEEQAVTAEKLKGKIETYQDNIRHLVKRITQFHNELNVIALRPKPVTDMAYIDILIQNEKNLQKEGWKQRLEMLEKCKTRSMTFASVVEKK